MPIEYKKLGKIQSVRFGYDNFMFGLVLTLGGEGWGTVTTYDYNPSYKYGSVETYAMKMLNDMQKLMKDAKVESVDKLKDKPIEATFEGDRLKSFRILTEVL